MTGCLDHSHTDGEDQKTSERSQNRGSVHRQDVSVRYENGHGGGLALLLHLTLTAHANEYDTKPHYGVLWEKITESLQSLDRQ